MRLGSEARVSPQSSESAWAASAAASSCRSLSRRRAPPAINCKHVARRMNRRLASARKACWLQYWYKKIPLVLFKTSLCQSATSLLLFIPDHPFSVVFLKFSSEFYSHLLNDEVKRNGEPPYSRAHGHSALPLYPTPGSALPFSSSSAGPAPPRSCTRYAARHNPSIIPRRGP